MKIILSGGGTGGHITPILAVAHDIKQKNPKCRVIYIGEKNAKFAYLTEKNSDIDEIHTIYAGKFRRYYGSSWKSRLLDYKTNLLNIRDFFYFLIGLVQSWRLMFRLKPDAVFLKGGFVGVPVGLAAAIRGLPYVTHDSDVVAGLANKIVSKWALYHATALPAENYPYSRVAVKTVGVIVSSDYTFVDDKAQAKAKEELGLPRQSTILLITGGSSGAVRINQAVSSSAQRLLEAYPKLIIIHQTGKGKSNVYAKTKFKNPRLQVLEFLDPMHKYMSAADLVVSRASANTLAELGVQSKAVIVIPHPKLADGHQLKNAALLQKQGAVHVVYESELYKLEKAIKNLLDDPNKRKDLAAKLQAATPHNATSKIVTILLKIADQYDVEE